MTARLAPLIGEAGSDPGQLEDPVGLEVDRDGVLWVADSDNDRVQGFGEDGGTSGRWDGPDRALGSLTQGGASDPWGNKWGNTPHRLQPISIGLKPL